MQLMRAVDVPETGRDVLYRASRLHAVLFVLITLGGCAAILYYRWPARKASYYIAGAILLLLLALRRFVTARFHPQNWLVRQGDEGLFIHFRSYLNEGLSGDDPTVLFLAYSEFRSARPVSEHLTVPDSSTQNRTETQILRWVELELTTDPAPIAAALDAEGSRSGATEKHWYGSSTTLYRDYPALMQVPPFLRLRWAVVPGAGAFLDALRDRVEILPKVVVKTDFVNLQYLPAEEQKRKLLELDRRGQRIAAVYLAQRLHRCTLAEATAIVNDLQKGSEAQHK
ncbi:MAG TPA: hypothetical protein VGG04_02470 [Candidatus Sulfotelmatobacter sp.]|jgi:hypothetical protein